MKLKLYFCTLDDCVAYYLVAAEMAHDCFAIIDRSEQISACGAWPARLKIEPATPHLLERHGATNDTNQPLLFAEVMKTLIMPEVIWSSDWSKP